MGVLVSAPGLVELIFGDFVVWQWDDRATETQLYGLCALGARYWRLGG